MQGRVRGLSQLTEQVLASAFSSVNPPATLFTSKPAASPEKSGTQQIHVSGSRPPLTNPGLHMTCRKRAARVLLWLGEGLHDLQSTKRVLCCCKPGLSNSAPDAMCLSDSLTQVPCRQASADFTAAAPHASGCHALLPAPGLGNLPEAEAAFPMESWHVQPSEVIPSRTLRCQGGCRMRSSTRGGVCGRLTKRQV